MKSYLMSSDFSKTSEKNTVHLNFACNIEEGEGKNNSDDSKIFQRVTHTQLSCSVVARGMARDCRISLVSQGSSGSATMLT